jgi:hypothetical protein
MSYNSKIRSRHSVIWVSWREKWFWKNKFETQLKVYFFRNTFFSEMSTTWGIFKGFQNTASLREYSEQETRNLSTTGWVNYRVNFLTFSRCSSSFSVSPACYSLSSSSMQRHPRTWYQTCLLLYLYSLLGDFMQVCKFKFHPYTHDFQLQSLALAFHLNSIFIYPTAYPTSSLYVKWTSYI